MPLRVANVQPHDIPRLLDIYFSSFKDPLRLAAFPETPKTRDWWHNNLANDLKTPGVTFVKCVDDAAHVGGDDSEVIVAFAQWRSQSREEEGAAEEKTVWPEDGDGNVADAYFGRAKELHNQLMHGEDHWYLEMICTAPEHQRRGAASMLIRALLNIADQDARKVYLEASPSGVSTYRRLGFVEKDRLGVLIKGGEYINLCMVREPAS